MSNSSLDVYLMVVFGLLGYVFKKLDCEPAPMMLSFILGPMIEEFLRRALLIADGNPMVFVTRPISAGLLMVCLVVLTMVMVPALRKKREEIFVET